MDSVMLSWSLRIVISGQLCRNTKVRVYLETGRLEHEYKPARYSGISPVQVLTAPYPELDWRALSREAGGRYHGYDVLAINVMRGYPRHRSGANNEDKAICGYLFNKRINEATPMSIWKGAGRCGTTQLNEWPTQVTQSTSLPENPANLLV